jgi:predicted RNase H-like HicB family nuclease
VDYSLDDFEAAWAAPQGETYTLAEGELDAAIEAAWEPQ